MTMTIEAVYTNGVLKPVESLDLPEQQRVRLIVEVRPGESDESARKAALERLFERIDKGKFRYGGPMPSRDELHERR